MNESWIHAAGVAAALPARAVPSAIAAAISVLLAAADGDRPPTALVVLLCLLHRPPVASCCRQDLMSLTVALPPRLESN
eukprot:SAG31_NODE_10305_length_1157_cov_1.207940_1_plen_78_part_10